MCTPSSDDPRPDSQTIGTITAAPLKGDAVMFFHALRSPAILNPPVRVHLAQLNPTIGDIDGNTAAIIAAVKDATRQNADLVVTSELAVIGYPPRDLLLREGAGDRCMQAVEKIAALCTKTAALVGFPQPWPRGPRPLRNAVALCRNGKVEAIYAKRLLPTYDVFDEDRYFTPGDGPLVVEVGGEKVGVLVCEDIWRAEDANVRRGYSVDPIVELQLRGATFLAVLSASPFVVGKDARHQERLQFLAAKKLGIISVNQAGGNDDLVFDGRSRVLTRNGATLACLRGFAADSATIETRGLQGIAPTVTAPEAETVDAIVAGIRDYLGKTGHREALLGLSGGIDSAIVAALATLAIGGGNVTGVLMPSRYSSPGSIDDALDSAARLKLKASPTIPIEDAHRTLRATLQTALGDVAGVVDENVQSRIRGVILMALSNASDAIVLTTGNKSEIAVGYATLYGDMNGGLAPIGDVLKTNVYTLARWMNEHFEALGFDRAPIPESSITKTPSAELRPDQSDQDTLPLYETLDAIVAGWVEREESVDTIVKTAGIERALVERWCRAIDRMQYKRDQGAVSLKVSRRAFGRGRPMPVAGKTV